MRTLIVALVLAACRVAPAHALDDLAPDTTLAAAQGAWSGTLVYRDYQRPDRTVTLPTRLFVALAAPDRLTLHYVFDDGPGKTVYSYQSLQADFGAKALRWTTGAAEKTETAYRIASDERTGGTRRLVFEGDSDGERVRLTLELGERTLTLRREELDANGGASLRNTFALSRDVPGPTR